MQKVTPVDTTGFEPMTFSLQGRRATNCAMCPQTTLDIVRNANMIWSVYEEMTLLLPTPFGKLE